MGFKKGVPRHPNAGRKKGTLNKRTLAEQACDKLGLNPFDLLVDAAVAGDAACLIQLCKHIEPPRKPVDLAVDPEANTIKLIVEDYTGSGNK